MPLQNFQLSMAVASMVPSATGYHLVIPWALHACPTAHHVSSWCPLWITLSPVLSHQDCLSLSTFQHFRERCLSYLLPTLFPTEPHAEFSGAVPGTKLSDRLSMHKITLPCPRPMLCFRASWHTYPALSSRLLFLRRLSYLWCGLWTERLCPL